MLDASVTLAWLFEDEHSGPAEAILGQVVASGALVPSLWRLEVANVLRNALRRNRCDPAFVQRSLARLSKLPITVDLETDIHAWGETYLLAYEEKLTVYDAAYLELAIRRRLPIASFDSVLIAAARNRGLRVV